MIAIIVLWILLGIIAFIVILLHFSVRAYIKADSGGIDIKVKYMFFTIYPRAKRAKKTKPSRKSKSYNKSEADLFADSLDDELEESDDETAQEILQESEEMEQPASEQTEDEKVQVGEEHDKFGFDELEKDFEDEKSDSEKQSEEKPPEAKAEKVEVKTVKGRAKKEKPKKEKKSKSSSSLKEKYLLVKPYIPKGWKAVKKLLKTVRITDLRIEVNVGREDAHEAAIYYGALQGALFNLLGTLAAVFTVKVKKVDVNCIFTNNTISGEGETCIRVRPSAMIAIAVCTAVNFLIIFLRERCRKRRKAKKAQSTETAAREAEPVMNNN